MSTKRKIPVSKIVVSHNVCTKVKYSIHFSLFSGKSFLTFASYKMLPGKLVCTSKSLAYICILHIMYGRGIGRYRWTLQDNISDCYEIETATCRGRRSKRVQSCDGISKLHEIKSYLSTSVTYWRQKKNISRPNRLRKNIVKEGFMESATPFSLLLWQWSEKRLL